ncbi:SRPBCC family protein [Gandjariella thermophila]|uniref:Polyketide cyclase n=1 Tax=Gandjariella thermophila TaxID=1931992 RepID=A0A4D4J463_9PSEU|nr:SRPBCC family protein [Gandjariella thermophila]GDY29538.1 polyketide cyclase [Gandjariella thermophila]
MAQVVVTAERVVEGEPERVLAALADYAETRPRMLTDNYREYEVREGGRGAGTRVHWKLQATKKRVRDCLVEVSEPEPGRLVERDTNSSMVTTWTVRPADGNRSTVHVETTWRGASGIGGFFERTFAPLGMRRIYDEVLGKLDTIVRS